MKMMKSFKNTIPNYLFLFVLCLPLFAFGQNGQKSLDRDFNWTDSNDTETVYIKVDKGAEALKMAFNGETTSGSLRITAYDPEGNKVSGLTLNCSTGDHSHVHVHTSDGHGSHSNSNTNSNTNSNSDSNSNVNVTTGGSGSSSVVTTTTTTSASGETKTKRKHKHKHKEKGKGEYTYEVSNSDSKGAKGVMKKKVKNPMAGNWKFVIETEDVSGTMKAKIDQD